MAGCWELREQTKVLVGILHTSATTVAWSLGLRNLMIPGHILPVAGMPYDHARNSTVQACLTNNYQYVFFLDSDVIPPRDTIHRLIARRLPVVSGLYCRRSPPHGVPVMIKDRRWVTEYVPGSLVEVDYVGAGCLLIHRSVLERLPPQDAKRGKHWFDWRVDCQGQWPVEQCLSEDFTFCVAAREKLGVKTMVDTSIVCRHVGDFEVVPGSARPLETVA